VKLCRKDFLYSDLKLFGFSVPLERVLFTIVRRSFQGSSRFYAAHVARAALTCRKINFLVVFPHLLSRLLFAVAHSSFRNGLRSADLRMSILRIFHDAHKGILLLRHCISIVHNVKRCIVARSVSFMSEQSRAWLLKCLHRLSDS